MPAPTARYADRDVDRRADYVLRSDPSTSVLRPPDLSAYRPVDAYASPRLFRYRPFCEYDRTADGTPAVEALLPPHLRLRLWPGDRRRC